MDPSIKHLPQSISSCGPLNKDTSSVLPPNSTLHGKKRKKKGKQESERRDIKQTDKSDKEDNKAKKKNKKGRNGGKSENIIMAEASIDGQLKRQSFGSGRSVGNVGLVS